MLKRESQFEGFDNGTIDLGGGIAYRAVCDEGIRVLEVMPNIENLMV